MSRLSNLEMLYSSRPDRRIVAFDQLQTPFRIEQLLTPYDIYQLYQIARSNRLAARPKEKYKMIDAIMKPRGFRKLASGTNRVVYKYMESQAIVLKIAIDSVGLKDNPAEFKNQNILKPFVTKVFQVTPCGTVGLFERVNPISCREEFMSVYDDIFDIIVTHFLGKYVLADFGSKYFMNWGVRTGSFPVLLDFPYLYELDGSKLQCNKPDPSNPHGYCLGDIDYDDGFNFLICQKCGKQYLAKSLELEAKNKSIVICNEEGDLDDMKVIINTSKGDVVVNETEKTTYTYKKVRKNSKYGVVINSIDNEDVLPQVVVTSGSDSNAEPKNPVISKEKVNDIKKEVKSNHEKYDINDFNSQVGLNTTPKVEELYHDKDAKPANEVKNVDENDNTYTAKTAEDLIHIKDDENSFKYEYNFSADSSTDESTDEY